MSPHPDATGLEIAIVGMAGRFPGAADIDGFWKNIRDGVESITRYTDQALGERGVRQELLSDPCYVKAAAPLDGQDLFDADFFGYAPREAELLDPQHRVFLECAWHALEHAGYDAQRHRGAIGVYAGTGANGYLLRHLLPQQGLGEGSDIADLLGLFSSNMADALATRVAYKLNLRGPAVTVQTACSTSLLAVHMACQSLLGHECDMALAGGVSLNLLQEAGYRYQAGAIFSPDGHCRAFDADAAGTLMGSGVGIVALRRLEDALRDGDTIHAVIKGSAANNDGSDKVGFAAPSVSGQAAVVRAAQAVAGVQADTIGYVEAHGTGTALGDPIEIEALTQAFRASTARRGYCAIGSVKTNVGHLDAAAGVTGLIKAVLALRHAILPPSLHFERPNPRIDFENSPFQVNTSARPWPAGPAARRAGVSAFGIGGTNVHVVLEEAPAPAAAQDDAGAWHVLPLSARHPAALAQMAQELAGHLRQAQPGPALADVAHTLQRGRRAFGYRCAVVAPDGCLAAQALEMEAAFLRDGGQAPAQVPSRAPEVAFLFPGGGVQHANMGLALYRSEPVFRREIDQCCDLLASETGWDLRQWLYPPAGREAAADQALSAMDKAQPALFVVGYALARLWMARGVQPALMLGHSLGEYVAACLAGVFELADALRIVAARGRLLHSLPPGAMTSVPLAEQQLQPLLDLGCDIGAINGERLCVLSGPLAAIEAAEQALRAQEITARRLHISVASHSAMTDAVLDELERVVASVPRQAPRLAFISSVTGQPITAGQATSPAYWARHLRRSVRFADGLDQLLGVPGRVLLEAGPGEALTSLARQHRLATTAAGIWPSQAHPRQQARNAQQMAQAMAGLWRAGVDVNWDAPGAARRVPLPGYAFQRRSHWVKARLRNTEAAPGMDGARDSAQDAGAGIFYAPAWQRAAAARTGEPASSRGTALVFGDEGGLTQALMQALSSGQQGAVRVDPGPSYARLAAGHYTVRPGERSDCEALLAAVQAEAGPVGAVYHLWGVQAGSTPSLPPQALLARGFHGVLALAQALQGQLRDGSSRCSLLVAASAAEDITGQEPLCPEMATLFPLCKVIGQECPLVDCRFVDLVLPQAQPALALLAGQLASEAGGAPAGDTAVALRGANRWVKSYAALDIPPRAQPRLRRNGVYLITGGLGGMGLALAAHLARHWQARLVLLGRSATPQRGLWESLAADPAQPEALRHRLQQLLALESDGAQLLVLSADVADGAQLGEAIAQSMAHFGRIDGVIHAAGQGESGLLPARGPEAVERVFAPKVAGTRHLLQALAGERLDFMLLCSSISSVAGGLGKSDYAAANAYLDAAAAAACRQLPYPVVSVNWDAWRDLGMAAGIRIPDGIGLEREQGTALFERIVNGQVPSQVLISTADLRLRLAQIGGGMLDALAAPTAVPRRVHPRPVLQAAYAAAQGELQQALADLWSEMLGITPVGVNDNLFELGGDSLLAIQILARVRKSFGVELHPAAFFDTPTIAHLAVLVETRLIEEIEAAMPGEGDPVADLETV
jgi:acyl transferase domain-containing protein/acyl carrier protein